MRGKIKYSIKNNNGITLIALVVTIIVLIILAGISINLVLGENGIITRAKEAKKVQEIVQIKEEIGLEIATKETEKLSKGNSITKTELKTILSEYGTINYEENETTIKSITTTEGNYEIPFKDIYTGTLKIAASDIEADASYIGKYVNYGGQETYKGVKWRIFNAENGQIQLIADNYIHKDVMPTATNIKKGTIDNAHSDYCVYAQDNRITLLNYINTTGNWSDFVAVTGAIVTGGPTLEQFKNSYNRTHGESSEATVKEIFIAKSEAMDDGLEGYYVGKSENPTTSYISGLKTTEMENLYVIDDNTNAAAYWLGSPSTNDANGVVIVNYEGYIGGFSCSNGLLGLRPLISLPSRITLVEQENGTYNVQL